jgi:hypothetical protein
MGFWRKIMQAASHYDASACIYAGQTGAPLGFHRDDGTAAKPVEKPKSASAATSASRLR